MKKIALVGLVVLCSAGAYAQGVVTFQPQLSGYYDVQVYSPNPGSPTVEEQGSTAAQDTYSGNPTTGSVTYGGVLIGGASYGGAVPVSFAGAVAAATAASTTVWTYGNLFSAELYALTTTTSTAIPNGTTLASLSPVTQYQSTFATGPTPYGAGFFNLALPASPDPGIPGTGYVGTGASGKNGQTGTAYLGNNAAAAVVAWYSGVGQFSTYELAKAAGVPTGYSAVFEITGLQEPASVMTDDNGTPSLGQTTPAYLVGNHGASYLQSFSLTTGVPEPSTIALGVMGACAFLARRRKK
jgi:hypothetical protein